MKVSIITCVLNNVEFIENAIKSFQSQTYENKEHIIIDGGSIDGTIEVIEKYKKNNKNLIFSSSIDKGIYNAINKGISLSSGDVIGILHSDDFYYDKDIISIVMNEFNNFDFELIYGDLEYVGRKLPHRIVRNWKSGKFDFKNIKKGWMPPHPTVFIRKFFFEEVGLYDTEFKISSDYDFLLRILLNKKLKIKYINKVFMKMRTGGKSNNSIKNITIKTFEDFKIIRKNKIGGFLTLFYKNFFKLKQFFL